MSDAEVYLPDAIRALGENGTYTGFDCEAVAKEVERLISIARMYEDVDEIKTHEVGHEPMTVRMYPSRKLVDPFDFHPEDVSIEDIAHHLSLINRYNGGTGTAISVGEHSLHVSAYLELLGHRDLALPGLLHDAPEAYIGDVVRPIKVRPDFTFYRKVDLSITMTICEAFEIPFALMDDPRLHDVDSIIVPWEKVMFRDVVRQARDPREIEVAFLERFHSLMIRRAS